MWAAPEHAEVLAALHGLSFPRPWQASEFEVLLRQPGVTGILAMENAAPTGFILLRAAADEAEILTLAVAPEHCRRGTASRLLQEAGARLHQAHVARWFLEVAADNVAARALYTRRGFTDCGQRPNYYSRPPAQAAIDAIVMMRPLDGDRGNSGAGEI